MHLHLCLLHWFIHFYFSPFLSFVSSSLECNASLPCNSMSWTFHQCTSFFLSLPVISRSILILLSTWCSYYCFLSYYEPNKGFSRVSDSLVMPLFIECHAEMSCSLMPFHQALPSERAHYGLLYHDIIIQYHASRWIVSYSLWPMSKG